ncbi:uncharacterized protein LOC117174456 [Belonocnema kinseyi]|uniref:uncharacterized protein LOC117174456 n=1 Tax=Belonocnema kinseyi TaxID=2817044 RepID=UPI00143D0E0A|nr:uncharacterized protein LOC117174456 [Belonocnema kinseyi]
MDSIVKDSSPSYSMVNQGDSDFEKGRTSTSDEPRSELPVKVATPEIIEKMSKMRIEDCRSTERGRNILHEYLGMAKHCARWVPLLLTVDQKSSTTHLPIGRSWRWLKSTN